MKFLLTVAAVIAVAVAVPAQRGLVVPGPAGPAPAPENPFEPIAIGPAIIDSFEPIAVGPAIVDGFEPIAVGPAIVDGFEPISVGPAIVDFPVPDSAVAPSPAVVAPASSPLVQIIVNVNQAESSPVAVSPVDTIAPEPVQVVETAPEQEPSPIGNPIAVNPIVIPEPVQVVEVAPEPIQIVDVLPEPVQVIEVAPAPAEPVQIGIPVLPEAAVVLPEDLN